MKRQLFSTPTQTLRTILIIASLIGMVFVQAVGFLFEQDLVTELVNNSIVRLLGGVAFLLVLTSFGYKYFRPFQKPFMTLFIVTLPGWIVVVNNLPLIAWITGKAEITESLGLLPLFILDCLSVGLFEEVIFRGVILVVLLQRLPQNKQGTLLSVVISSAIFALIHLFNLFAGAAVGATLLQVSYSFGMGLLWAVVFLATGSIWSAVLLHATYNFTGLLFVTMGTMYGRYDVVTVTLTVLFAMGAAYYYWKVLNRLNVNMIQDLVTPTE